METASVVLYLPIDGSKKSFAPYRATPRSAGLDLKTPYKVTVPAGQRIAIDTRLKLVLPVGHYGRIASKSGLSLRYGIEVGAGVVDCHPEDTLKILLYNFSNKDFELFEGAPVAQLICERNSIPAVIRVDEPQCCGILAGVNNVLYYEKLSEDVPDLISRQKRAGIHLRTPERVKIRARQRKLVDLRIKIRLAPEHYGRICSTYRNSSMRGIEVGAGVVDEDYQGSVMVVVLNHSDIDCIFEKGDTIAQMICQRISYPTLRRQDEKDVVEETTRNTGGFGSTYLPAM